MKGTSPSRVSGSEVARHRSAMMVMRSSINNSRKGEVMKIITLGIDLAKDVFAVHGIDETVLGQVFHYHISPRWLRMAMFKA